MNLWVKRTGQLLVAVLFLMSCEDDSFLLGFRNQNKKFNLRYQEFTLPSSVITIDSLTTDNNYAFDIYRLLIGQYMDPAFGTVHAESYTQIQQRILSALEEGAIYDSITLQLRLDFYSYGSEGTSIERFTVHEITEDSLSVYRRYYYNSSLGYDPTSLGEASFEVDYDDLQRNAGRGSAADTLLFEVKLDDSFGQKVFENSLYNIDSAFAKSKVFKNNIKGLVFVPSQNNMIVGISIDQSLLSKVTLHYHTLTTDSLTRIFTISSGALSFNKISTNRTGDLSGITQTYEGIPTPLNTSGLRYLQNGSPVISKLDISAFNDFVSGKSDGVNDSLTKIVINSAEISMEVDPHPAGMSPPSVLEFRIMSEDDLFLNSLVDEDSAAMAGFYVVTTGKYYFPINDAFSQSAQTVALSYNSSTKKYSGFITLFMQNLFDRKDVETKIEYLGLVPYAPAPGKTVDRAVIKANSIKLKVNYTSPSSNQE